MRKPVVFLAMVVSSTTLLACSSPVHVDRDGHELSVHVLNRRLAEFDLEVRPRYGLSDAQVPELSRVWNEYAAFHCGGGFGGRPIPVYQEVVTDGVTSDGGRWNSSSNYVKAVSGHVLCRHGA